MPSLTPQEINEILDEYFSETFQRTYIGKRYVPIFGRKGESTMEWDNDAPYEPLTVVLYEGNSYTSRQYVPIGAEITDTDFWVLTGNYNAQVEEYRQEVESYTQAYGDAIGALEDALPIENFDSVHTVASDLSSLDSRVDDIESFIPISSFDNINTVKSYLDSNKELSENIEKMNVSNILKGQYIAHQGALTSAPGNSEWAFICAGKCGYKIAECDVQRTSDGVYVLSHGTNLSDMTNQSGLISETAYSTLSTYQITKGYNANLYTQSYCTLERYLEICNEFSMIPLIEDNSDPNEEYCIEIADIMINMGFFDGFYMSGYIDNCIAVKTKYPFINTVFLKSTVSASDIQSCVEAGVCAVHCSASDITSSMVTDVHEAGLLIGGWNTGASNIVKTLWQMGVDFINIDGYVYCSPDTVSTTDEFAIGKIHQIPYYSKFTYDLAKAKMFTTGGVFSTSTFADADSVSFAKRNNYGYMGPFIGQNLVVEITPNDDYQYAVLVVPVQGTQTQLDTSWLSISTKTKFVVPNVANASATTDDSYTFIVAKKLNDDAVFGDIDFVNASQYINVYEQNLFRNLVYGSTGWKYQRGEMGSILFPCENGMTIPYDGTHLPANLKFMISGFKADFTWGFDSGWKTDSGTYTVNTADVKYITFYFKLYNSDWKCYDLDTMKSVSTWFKFLEKE